MYMKTNTIVSILVGLIILGGLFYYFKKSDTLPFGSVTTNQQSATTPATTTVKTIPVVDKTKTVIGTSVQNRAITAYHFGTGAKEILFVGGIHGGYSWNTSLLAYELMDYLRANPNAVPSNVTVTVIPVLNPDGLSKVVSVDGRFTKADVSPVESVKVSGRFNANNVDLSRNFDCNWKAVGVWQTKPVSGGTAVFSEPESLAIKNYVDTHTVVGAVIWYSAAGGVYASRCNDVTLAQTMAITELYAKASTYPAHESYDFYETTGDMVNWLASKSIPAISVLLTTHEATEWSKNLSGVKSLLTYYATQK